MASTRGRVGGGGMNRADALADDVQTLSITDADLDAIADRVLERLARQLSTSSLVDAATLAGILNVSRDTIYQHATELGGQRIGDGPRGRFRFDPKVALERWNYQAPAKTAAPVRPRRTAVPLLPIRG